VRLLLLSAILDLDLTALSLIYPGFLPLTNFHMQDDAKCQSITSTPEKKRSCGPAGKHSLTPNNKLANEPNRKRHQGSVENFEKPSAGEMDSTAFFL